MRIEKVGLSMIKRYKKKQVVVDAIQYTRESSEACVRFCGKQFVGFVENELIIETLEGNHRASFGDYIIKGVKGEIYPCKPDIFEMTYEEVKRV